MQNTGSRPAGFSSGSMLALEQGLRSCGTQSKLLPGMWDLPRAGPEVEHVCPALVGRFLTIATPGKALGKHLFKKI